MKSSLRANAPLQFPKTSKKQLSKWQVIVIVFVCAAIFCVLGSVYLPLTIPCVLLITLIVFALMFVPLVVACRKTRGLLEENKRLSVLQNQARFRLDNFLKNNPAVIYTADTTEDFPIRYITPNVKDLTGYTSDAFTNDPMLWKSLIEPEDQGIPFRDIQLLFKEGRRIVDYRIHHKDGRLRWVRDEMRLVASEFEEPMQIIGNWSDITNRKVSEQIMRESEGRFHAMAENASFMIWVSNQKGGCVFFNKAWLRFRGRSLIQEMGHGWMEGVHSQDQEYLQETILEARALHRPMDLVYRLKGSDGDYSYMHTQASPRFLKDGTFYGYIGSTIDITDLKDAMRVVDEISVEHYSKMALFSKSLLLPFNALKDHIEHFSDLDADIWKNRADEIVHHLHDRMHIIMELSRLKAHQQCLVQSKFFPREFFDKWLEHNGTKCDMNCVVFDNMPEVLRADAHLISEVCSLIVSKFSSVELDSRLDVSVEWRDTLEPNRMRVSFAANVSGENQKKLSYILSKDSNVDMDVILIEDIISVLDGSIMPQVQGNQLEYIFEIPLQQQIV